MEVERNIAIIDSMAKRKGYDSVIYLRRYDEVCQKHDGDYLSIWLYMIRYSEFNEFPEPYASQLGKGIDTDEAKELSEKMIEFQYPDLQNIYGCQLVYASRGIEVLCELLKQAVNQYRDTAIYAILHNAFYRDKNHGTFELPEYIKVAPTSYFISLFFKDFYHYKGKYKEDIYVKILSSICSMCDLSNNVLHDNLGSILTLLERDYDNLERSKKEILLRDIDNVINTYSFNFKEYSEAESRIVAARGKLLYDLFAPINMESLLNDLSKYQVHFEGWNIDVSSHYCASNREVIVLLSWLYVIRECQVEPDERKDICYKIFRQLILQTKEADVTKDVYELALDILICSLNKDLEFYENIILEFIQTTDNLYFVISVLDKLQTLQESHRTCLAERWSQESDIVRIKIKQDNVWTPDAEKLYNRLGLK